MFVLNSSKFRTPRFSDVLVIGISTMSSIWNVEDMNAEYSSNLAKFRNLIREMKQRADLG